MNKDILIDSYILTDNNLQDYLNNINKIPLLTIDEEKEVGYKILYGDKDAKNNLIIHNLKLVVVIAKHYIGFGLSLLDLIGEGNIGLIEAANRFDIRKGHRFSTYASKWIISKIEIGIANTSRNIRIPYHTFEKVKKYKKIKEKLTISLNRIPFKEELAQEMNETINNINLFESIINDTLSLNYLIGEDNVELGNLIADERNIEEQIIQKELPSIIKNIFEDSEVDDIDIDILTKRYNLDGLGIRTFEEIGQDYKKTKAWAHQKEAKALKKLQKSPYLKQMIE